MPSTYSETHLSAKIPASAPVSPLAHRVRSTSAGHRPSPVTPQRFTRGFKLYENPSSPITPGGHLTSPHTPLTARSYGSSDGSMLETPPSVSNNRRLNVKLSLQNIAKENRDRSVADLTENWRFRAKENGIKVSSGTEDPHYADDEASDHSAPECYPENLLQETLLPPPFPTAHRRVRAQSEAVLPRKPLYSQIQGPLSPTRYSVATTPVNTRTPPAKASLAQHRRLKGCLTEPPRRLPSLMSQINSDLFELAASDTSYAPYPSAFSSPLRPIGLPINFNDTFDGGITLSTITEAVQQHFEPRSSSTPKASVPLCSVCGRSSGALAILKPCGHPLCSACLTSALNIVGEKDMACALCKAAVKDFHLQASNSPAMSDPFASSSDGGSAKLLPSAFEFSGRTVDHLHAFDHSGGASMLASSRQQPTKNGENIVLRIDNVPWDITPPAMCTWLDQPVESVHVLLDRKGKTLSHAFIEVANEDIAKAALRSAQNSVLGKGKRARGVTVTRSSQEELMRALFPNWQGSFDGSRPSLAGLSPERVIATLESGLISDLELGTLLHLIRSPVSHFLKVPSLPFYFLVSILSKFPTDVDSRVFWSGKLRDGLFDVTFGAIQILLSRNTTPDTQVDPELLFQLAHVGVNCQAFTGQQREQLNALVGDSFATYDSPPSPPSPAPRRRRNATHEAGACAPAADRSHSLHADEGAGAEREWFGAIADEFGVETDLVRALAERLSALTT